MRDCWPVIIRCHQKLSLEAAASWMQCEFILLGFVQQLFNENLVGSSFRNCVRPQKLSLYS